MNVGAEGSWKFLHYKAEMKLETINSNFFMLRCRNWGQQRLSDFFKFIHSSMNTCCVTSNGLATDSVVDKIRTGIQNLWLELLPLLTTVLPLNKFCFRNRHVISGISCHLCPHVFRVDSHSLNLVKDVVKCGKKKKINPNADRITLREKKNIYTCSFGCQRRLTGFWDTLLWAGLRHRWNWMQKGHREGVDRVSRRDSVRAVVPSVETEMKDWEQTEIIAEEWLKVQRQKGGVF